MPMSPTMTEEVLKERSNSTVCELVTITYDGWDEPVRICTVAHEVVEIDSETNRPLMGIISRDETYYYVGVSVVLPSSQDESPPEATVYFSHVGREVGEKLKIVSDYYPRVMIEVVSTLDPDTVELEFSDMKLSSANWNNSEGEITLVHDIASNEPCPHLTFSISSFPNLFNN